MHVANQLIFCFQQSYSQKIISINARTIFDLISAASVASKISIQKWLSSSIYIHYSRNHLISPSFIITMWNVRIFMKYFLSFIADILWQKEYRCSRFTWFYMCMCVSAIKYMSLYLLHIECICFEIFCNNEWKIWQKNRFFFIFNKLFTCSY